MVRFYDPVDSSDQKKVEQALRSGGIEYFLRDAPAAGLNASEIFVAEEDLPEAEQLLAGSRH
jgi:hypothetical protein